MRCEGRGAEEHRYRTYFWRLSTAPRRIYRLPVPLSTRAPRGFAPGARRASRASRRVTAGPDLPPAPRFSERLPEERAFAAGQVTFILHAEWRAGISARKCPSGICAHGEGGACAPSPLAPFSARGEGRGEGQVNHDVGGAPAPHHRPSPVQALTLSPAEPRGEGTTW
jgi:hypothetical protein